MQDFLLFVAVGFLAQLVDGAIGMAYGLTSMSVLLGLGVGPATASASVHVAEVFTTSASALSHWRLGNIRPRLVAALAFSGMLGGATGAYVLVISPGDVIMLTVSAYLLVMGCIILIKALRPRRSDSGQPMRHMVLLGAIGGFLDAAGGGGWGAIVTSTLVGRGLTPRLAIGSSNAAEFFVASVVSVTFLGTIGLQPWPIIGGLIVGGVLAAPVAAYAARYLPERLIMTLVGGVIVLLSFRQVVTTSSWP
ncbi:sulfite exporter TauE/SafE family protein [Limibacillus sp. MBR-115]|uniref:sulfite exporter TauE/SafE family protein n=1 Tax=Limibacillus sp. MBR-115 TaxID=3156465 RepID=UPI00339B8528